MGFGVQKDESALFQRFQQTMNCALVEPEFLTDVSKSIPTQTQKVENFRRPKNRIHHIDYMMPPAESIGPTMKDISQFETSVLYAGT